MTRRRQEGRRRVLRVRLRAGRRLPDDRAPSPVQQPHLYGAAKAFNEGLLRSFHEMYGLDYVALRYFNVYGPRMDVYGAYTEVLIRWMERIAAGQPPLIFGDGTQTMDFVYVARHRPGQHARRRRPTSPTRSSTSRAAPRRASTSSRRRSLRVMGSSPEAGVRRRTRKVNPVPRRLADVDRAASCSASRPRSSLEEGCATSSPGGAVSAERQEAVA